MISHWFAMVYRYVTFLVSQWRHVCVILQTGPSGHSARIGSSGYLAPQCGALNTFLSFFGHQTQVQFSSARDITPHVTVTSRTLILRKLVQAVIVGESVHPVIRRHSAVR